MPEESGEDVADSKRTPRPIFSAFSCHIFPSDAYSIGVKREDSTRVVTIDWQNVRGNKFAGDEARQASDFAEVLWNMGLKPDEAYEMFKDDNLPVGKRLYFAEKISFDKATLMLLLDTDERIRGVIDARLREERLVPRVVLLWDRVWDVL